MKRVISLFCLVALLLSCSSFAWADTDTIGEAPAVFESIDTFESRIVPLYEGSIEKETEIELWFANGEEDIPFISVEAAAGLLTELMCEEGSDATLELLHPEDGIWILMRENGSGLYFSFRETTVLAFSDIDLFARRAGAVNSLDLVQNGSYSEEEGIQLILAQSVLYAGADVTNYILDDYHIPSVLRDGMGYIPLQVLSDLVLSTISLASLYNRNCVILTNTINAGDPLYDLYYEGEPHVKSRALTYFNYYELCLALDANYGLAEEHGIDSFASFFTNTGLFERLLSDEAGDTASLLTDLTLGYFCDGHSGLGAASYMASADYQSSGMIIGSSLMSMMRQKGSFMDARSAFYPEGANGYEEVGNTAVITFDHFIINADADYYNMEPTNNPDDTVELLLYANRQINREDSPIENVVLDLTCNSGGMLDAAVCVISWCIGSTSFNVVNAKTGAQAQISYFFDADLDHDMGFNDMLNGGFDGKNLFCLISGGSFSCGNLVPAVLQSSGCVTLIGQTSGGGACAVGFLSTADGSLFRLSSHMRINTVKNGIFYSVDQGATPDVHVSDPSHLYDRQYLVDYINNLI